MKYHIEFLGQPGSGKTTLYNKLIKSNKNRIYSLSKAVDISTKRSIKNSKIDSTVKKTLKYLIYQVSKNFVYPIYKTNEYILESYNEFLINEPDFTKKILKYMRIFNFTTEEKKSVFGWIMFLTKNYYFVKSNLSKDENLIIDEGFIHKGISFYQRKNNNEINGDEFIQEYLKTVFIPDILIYIDTDKEICLKRMSERNKYPKPFVNISKKERIELLKNNDVYINKVINYLTLYNTKMLKINNNNSLNESLKNLTDQLLKLTEE